MGIKDCPRSESEYSTLGGICGYSFLTTSPSASSSFKEEESVLLMAAEGFEFEEAEYWYDRLMKHLGWTSLGKVLAGGVMEAGAIEGSPKLQEAEALGEKL